MSRSFKLTTAKEDGWSRIAPSQGEELGATLREVAQTMLARQTAVTYNYDRIATLFELAGDAFDLGASASIGHNRTDRYMAARRECLDKAAELREELEKDRKRVEAKRQERSKGMNI